MTRYALMLAMFCLTVSVSADTCTHEKKEGPQVDKEEAEAEGEKTEPDAS